MDIKALSKRYSGHVAKLLTLGRPKGKFQNRHFYRDEMGIDESDLEQLMELACDVDIYNYDFGEVSDDEAKEFFGVIHAWRALSELAVPEAKTFFTASILSVRDPLYDDWVLSEFRDLMAPFRAGMFEEAAAVIADESINEWVRLEYLELVREMLARGEVSRDKVNTLLSEIFATSQSLVINAFAIGICTDNKLVEHHEAIAKCYEKGLVDLEHLGDLEDVEIAFGMRAKRETKRELTESQKIWNGVMKKTGAAMELDKPTRMPSVNKEEKIGRNDPCPCGSGKKYKKCCMKK